MMSWRALCGLAALSYAATAWGLSNPASANPLSRSYGTTPLCELLESIRPGERRSATVRGILVLGYETTMLYDPDSPGCPLDVQPTTEVAWSENVPGTKQLNEAAAQSERRAYVTLRGVLWGPGKVGEDDLSALLIVSYIRRAPPRYGHLAYSRTKFVVDAVLESAPVPAEAPSMGEFSKRWPESAIPVLQEAAVPRYPDFARNMEITGEVIVDVTIKGGRATATVVKAGDRALASAVLENIKTWRFREKVEATFTTKFEFSLELRKAGDDRNDRLVLNLPSAAKIVGARNGW